MNKAAKKGITGTEKTTSKIKQERPLPFLPETGSEGGGSDPDSLRLSCSGSGDGLELEGRPLPLRDDRRWLLASDAERCTQSIFGDNLLITPVQRQFNQ